MKRYGNPPALFPPLIGPEGVILNMDGGLSGGTLAGDTANFSALFSGGLVTALSYTGGVCAGGSFTVQFASPIYASFFELFLQYSGSASTGPGAQIGFGNSGGLQVYGTPRVDAGIDPARGGVINLLGEQIILAAVGQLQVGWLRVDINPGAGNSRYWWARKGVGPAFVLLSEGAFAGSYSPIAIDRFIFNQPNTGGVGSTSTRVYRPSTAR